jgi:hypothetical protein
MAGVDFVELKRDITLSQVLGMLDINNLKPEGERLRGPCPICNTSRSFVVTPGKGWYCHHCKTGGDIIKLVQLVRGFEGTDAARDAALAIQAHFTGAGTVHGSTVHRATVHRDTVPKGNRTSPDKATQLQNVLDRLQPEHEAVQALCISPETAKLFESGYNPSGVQKGRYSVALRSVDGQLETFIGIAVTAEQSPRMAFSNFDPATALFNANRIAEGVELTLCRSPLDLILAIENGAPIDSLIAFLTETVSPTQLEILSSLMDQKKIESLWP